MNEKERLLKTLKGEKVDRHPVICPGGMMSACVTEVLDDVEDDHNLTIDGMVKAARNIYKKTGFENYGVPFAMVAEAELLGVTVDSGTKTTEERIIEYNNDDLDDIINNYDINPNDSPRMKTTIESIKILKNDKVPVIGNLVGHVSTATSIVDPLVIFKKIKKDPEKVYDFFKFVNNILIKFADEMIKAGADAIAISDPTSTGEILGTKNFEKFSVPFYKELINFIHDKNTPVILHICGDVNNIIDGLSTVGADALSFDSCVNMRFAKSKISTKLMGNVSTQLLDIGTKEKIVSITENAILSGVDIVSPACGLSMSTSTESLRSMTDYIKGRNI
ncbi:methylcobamide:CoM methyltransferase MtbA [Gottschalkia acidurici 9a]|uniref:Methylcobamide:CoM methyltransferase MtbA n=1 Tax=Gottschalkia acidurici (strain ATCC 7906 / DSM 604 / BCRC 14475 / CIP 104303 / KCTC 5404 / NCIMB 10678 / 9a) TaxID=1128398 RepID=K0AZM6_GOTA9|nr:uroporphyrinogen decarboxylase family protein [Gottschalkia acidurici]AFS78170.1 methylcobamide:CoM methyltransferase MtbA [Gottschalkia acidurici 9a]